MKEPSVFRNCVAKHIRKLRRWGCSRTEISVRVVSFCEGWIALSNEMDKVSEKYEK